ncbi:MAG TPA: TIGR02757 family protein [Thermoanaerobaculia bacterium]|nr:TIGR02757 family protein [Thermoanaerobaculia bacterium]
MRVPSASAARLHGRLEALYRRYGVETVGTDPIVFPRRYASDADREVAGWIATAFAYGQVPTIQASVGKILAALGPSPAAALDRVADFRALAGGALAGFRHRFHGARDAAALLYAIARARAEYGSVRAFFESELRDEDADVAPLLSRAVRRLLAFDWRPVLGSRRIPERSPVRFFFPDPGDGSACKRWNLYLRWMVRRDAVDFGLWRGIPARRLVVPTDTHVHRIARRLGLTRRRTADWLAARQITDAFARFDPEDPVRFDYALCRIGILDICRPRPADSLCDDCPVQSGCSIGRRRAARTDATIAPSPLQEIAS